MLSIHRVHTGDNYHPGEERNELDRLKRRGPLIESIQMTSQKEKQNAKKESNSAVFLLVPHLILLSERRW